MQLLTLNGYRSGDTDDDAPLGVLVIAETLAEAEQMCFAKYKCAGYSKFELRDTLSLQWPGSARVIGSEGDPAWTWK